MKKLIWISLLLLLIGWSCDIHAQALSLQKKNRHNISYYYKGDIIKISLSDKQHFYEIYIDSISPKMLISYGNYIPIDSIKFVARAPKKFNYTASAGSFIAAGLILPLIVVGNNLLNSNRPLISANFIYSSAVLVGAGALLLSLEQKDYALHKKYSLVTIEHP